MPQAGTSRTPSQRGPRLTASSRGDRGAAPRSLRANSAAARVRVPPLAVESTEADNIRPWDAEPDWRRKEKERHGIREEDEDDMRFQEDSVATAGESRVESRTLYAELCGGALSEEANNAMIYGIVEGSANADRSKTPLPMGKGGPRFGTGKTIKRSGKRTRPRTSAGGRDGGESGSEDEGARHRTGSELDFGGPDIMDDKAWDTDLEGDDTKDVFDHSSQAVYTEACKKAGVVPASYFLRHMNDSKLQMKHHGLGPQGIRPICVTLVSNTTVVKLSFQDNWLGPRGGQAVGDMLKENCYITDVDISDNHCGPSLASVIKEVMETNTTISRLVVSGNDLDDSAAPVLAEAIATNQRIETLDLSHNSLGERAGLVLGPAIAENTALRQLNLSWNHIRRKGALAVAAGVKGNVFMKKIDLSWNGMGNDGAKALGDALKANNTLQELDLSNNRITTEGVVLLGKGVSVNEALQTLTLGKNPMQSAGCFAMVTALLKNQGSPSLINLDFTDILVNADFKQLMNTAKEAVPGLQIKYGPVRIQPRPKPRAHPMIKLRAYVERHELKLIDFFNKFDKDGSMSVTRDEFIEGLEAIRHHRITLPNGKEIGVGLTEDEVTLLLNELDRDGDGEINYSELVLGSAAMDLPQATENRIKPRAISAMPKLGTVS